ncbi:TatD family hydrolase, partial [Planococcus sp. SIMBA_143]
NEKKPKEVAKEIPLEKLLIETDCPYLAPHPYRGKRNEPAYVKLVAEQIAELKKGTLEEVEKMSTEKAKKLFNIN